MPYFSAFVLEGKISSSICIKCPFFEGRDFANCGKQKRQSGMPFCLFTYKNQRYVLFLCQRYVPIICGDAKEDQPHGVPQGCGEAHKQIENNCI